MRRSDELRTLVPRAVASRRAAIGWLRPGARVATGRYGLKKTSRPPLRASCAAPTGLGGCGATHPCGLSFTSSVPSSAVRRTWGASARAERHVSILCRDAYVILIVVRASVSVNARIASCGAARRIVHTVGRHACGWACRSIRAARRSAWADGAFEARIAARSHEALLRRQSACVARGSLDRAARVKGAPHARTIGCAHRGRARGARRDMQRD